VERKESIVRNKREPIHPGSNAGKLNKHKRGELMMWRESDTFILL
jgi:hypothetical protein